MFLIRSPLTVVNKQGHVNISPCPCPLSLPLRESDRESVDELGLLMGLIVLVGTMELCGSEEEGTRQRFLTDWAQPQSFPQSQHNMYLRGSGISSKGGQNHKTQNGLERF